MDTSSAGLNASGLDTDGVRILTLNRPDKANAIDLDLARALLSWVKLSTQDRCKALIFAGAGKNFCAGFDFSNVEATSAGDVVERFALLEQAFQHLRSAPFVSFALVQGAAFGAGADLVLACTYRIGAARARFRFPGFQFGVALGTRYLASIVGMQAARDILLRNRIIAADEALRLGLLTHLGEDDELRGMAEGLAAEIGALHPEAIRRIHAMTMEHDEEGDLSELVKSLLEPSLHERIAAYRQKRI